LNIYGNMKLSGEYFIRVITNRHFIVRVSVLFRKSPCRAKVGMNFEDSMLTLSKERDEVRVVNNEKVSSTNTLDITKQ
jgi:dTDP-4-dehydrorhamnose reductase